MQTLATWVKRVLKWAGIGVLALLGLGVALSLIGFAINLRDEPLTSQAQALLVPPPNPYAPADNIYFALVGFEAPEGTAPFEAGQARIEHYNAKLSVASFFNPESVHEAAPPGLLQFQGSLDFVQPLNRSVWRDAPSHAAEVQKLLRDNAALYARYRALHHLAGFYNTARPSFLEPVVFREVNSTHKLFLADSALRIRGGEPQRGQAFSELGEDVLLWRRVLTGHGELISKMIAIAYLQGDALLVADVVADPAVSLPASPTDADALAPLFPLADWDIADAFLGEFRSQELLMRSLGAQSASAAVWAPGHPTLWDRFTSWWTMRFFKPQATVNLFARMDSQLRSLAAVDPANTARLQSWDPASQYIPPASWARLTYNPVGRILATIGKPVMREYPLRASDGAALQRLVRLGYEIRRQRISELQIPAFMAQHAEWATHPGDAHPFLWNPPARALSLRPLAPQTTPRRFAIAVWGAPTRD
jgi:hypothetical protein